MVMVKTEAGQRVLKDRSVALSPRQRSAFILFDGKRTADAVLAQTAPMGVTRDDIDRLVVLGLLHDPAQHDDAQERFLADTVPAGLAELPEQPPRSAQQRYAEAYPIAMLLTASLGLKGFRLSMAVEACGSYEQLLALAPRIREAAGPEKYLPLALALHDG